MILISGKQGPQGPRGSRKQQGPPGTGPPAQQLDPIIISDDKEEMEVEGRIFLFFYFFLSLSFIFVNNSVG